MKRKSQASRKLDVEAAIAYVRDVNDANSTEQDKRRFEQGARRMLNYLYMNNLLAADEW